VGIDAAAAVDRGDLPSSDSSATAVTHDGRVVPLDSVALVDRSAQEHKQEEGSQQLEPSAPPLTPPQGTFEAAYVGRL
jgi:hypothetical protein